MVRKSFGFFVNIVRVFESLKYFYVLVKGFFCCVVRVYREVGGRIE